MMIQKAILHVLDFGTSMCLLSQKELDLSIETVYDYVSKRVEKSLHDPAGRTGIFYETSALKRQLEAYVSQDLSFQELADSLAKAVFESLKLQAEANTTDLLVTSFKDEAQREGMALFFLENRTAYTHRIMTDEDGVYSQIIEYQAVLPGLMQKVEAYVFIDLSDFTLRFVDKKRSINGEDVYALPELILQCTTVLSGKETVKKTEKLLTKVAEEYGKNPVKALAKGKQYLAQTAETGSSFAPQAFGEAAFAGEPALQGTFTEKLRQAEDIPKEVKVESRFAERTGTVHKIKTDTGIEITFPSSYMENPDFIQFFTRPDGTLSIELKGIGKIINK